MKKEDYLSISFLKLFLKKQFLFVDIVYQNVFNEFMKRVNKTKIIDFKSLELFLLGGLSLNHLIA